MTRAQALVGDVLTPKCNGISVARMCRRYGISRHTYCVYQRRLYSDSV
jgi:hypothetical protein